MNKRIISIGAALLMLAVLFIAGVGVAAAHDFRSGDNVTTASDKAINESVFAAGRTVDVSSEVFGDVFVAGQTVTVSGKVHGDVIAAGQTVSVSGAVDGDVRLAGQTINLSAPVAGNATIAGQSFILDSRGSIGGDLTGGATDASLNGKIGRDAALGGESVIIGGTIGRNVKATGNKLQLTSGARVTGNVDLTSEKDVVRSDGAVVGGKVTRHDPPKQEDNRGAVFGLSVAWFLYLFLAMLFTALALALAAPRLLEAATNRALPRPWMALLVGFVASIIVPMGIFIIAITVVGLPLAFIAGLAWLLMVLLSGPLFAYYIGRLLFRGPRNVLLTMLVGAAILAALYFIPVLGFFAILAAIWIGSGMLLLWAYGHAPKPVYQVE